MQIVNTTTAVINGYEQLVVNARELWEKLESKQQFADWIKNRLADFDEGKDFTVHKIMNGENKGRFAANEYTLTLDTAKHLAMLERNENGKKIRQYFIEIEKGFYQAKEEQQKIIPSSRRPANIAATTAELIEKINLQLIAGMEVEPEVLRYAWNIGRLVGETMRKPVPDEIEEFIMGLASGKYSRGEVYEMYRSSVRNPKSARCFWPLVRAIRSCDEVKDARTRYVIFW